MFFRRRVPTRRIALQASTHRIQTAGWMPISSAATFDRPSFPTYPVCMHRFVKSFHRSSRKIYGETTCTQWSKGVSMQRRARVASNLYLCTWENLNTYIRDLQILNARGCSTGRDERGSRDMDFWLRGLESFLLDIDWVPIFWWNLGGQKRILLGVQWVKGHEVFIASDMDFQRADTMRQDSC